MPTPRPAIPATAAADAFIASLTAFWLVQDPAQADDLLGNEGPCVHNGFSYVTTGGNGAHFIANTAGQAGDTVITHTVNNFPLVMFSIFQTNTTVASGGGLDLLNRMIDTTSGGFAFMSMCVDDGSVGTIGCGLMRIRPQAFGTVYDVNTSVRIDDTAFHVLIATFDHNVSNPNNLDFNMYLDGSHDVATTVGAAGAWAGDALNVAGMYAPSTTPNTNFFGLGYGKSALLTPADYIAVSGDIWAELVGPVVTAQPYQPWQQMAPILAQ